MIVEKLLTLLAEQFDVDEDSITMDTTFKGDLGADSLDIVELSMSMEDAFGIDEMSEEEISKIVTVGDLVDFLKERLD